MTPADAVMDVLAALRHADADHERAAATLLALPGDAPALAEALAAVLILHCGADTPEALYAAATARQVMWRLRVARNAAWADAREARALREALAPYGAAD